MDRVIRVLDEMVKDEVITDYVIGGATALLYYTIPHFVTEDIDVFVYSKSQGEYIILEGFPVQFLVPYDQISREAFANAVPLTMWDVRFKVFSLEYNMAIMIQLGDEKYFERLRILRKHKLFDEAMLASLLERFNLAGKWSALVDKMEMMR